MKSLLFAFLGIMLLAGCTASDQEPNVSHKTDPAELSQTVVPISYDSNGDPFVEVNGEKIGVDFEGQNPKSHTHFVMTKREHKDGRTVVDLTLPFESQ